MATGILKFFKPDTNSDFPDPNGSLSADIPSKAIAAANKSYKYVEKPILQQGSDVAPITPQGSGQIHCNCN